MGRLNRNHRGYQGETIDIAAVLQACDRAAGWYGWTVEQIRVSPGVELSALRRRQPSLASTERALRIYLSAGIHGDEPAGPLAMQRLLEADTWPTGAELWVVPCLNPTGFPFNRRENAAGLDLNRDYRHLQSAEVRAHTAWMDTQPSFDVTFCLHEDWEAQGFYVYELNPDRQTSLAARIIEAVEVICPIDRSEVIEGRAAANGIIRPSLDPASRPQWPEAFWLLQRKTRLSYTLEAPSELSLETRVDALVAGLKGALSSLL